MPVDLINPIDTQFPPERIPWSDFNSPGDGNQAEIFDITAFEEPGKVTIAYLTDLATESVASVEPRVTRRRPVPGSGGTQPTSGGRITSPTSSWPADALRGIDDPIADLDLFATERLRVQLFNDTGGGIGDHRTWGTVVFDDPSLLDMIARDIRIERDADLIGEFDLDRRFNFGNLPTKPIGAEVDRERVTREIVREDILAESVTPPSGSSFNNFGTIDSLAEDFMVAATGLAMTPKTGTFGSGDVKYRIIRDGQQVIEAEGFAMPAVGTTVPMWIPADDDIDIELSGDGANTVEFRLRTSHFPKTEIDWVRWFPIEDAVNNTDLSREEAEDLQDFLTAGVQPQAPGAE